MNKLSIYIKSTAASVAAIFHKHHILIALVLSFSVLLSLIVVQVHAATLTSGSVSLSDPRPSQTATYQLTFSDVSTTQIACIAMVFTSAASGSTAGPTGLSVTSATLDTTSSTNYIPNPGGWSKTAPQANIAWLTFSGGTSPASGSARTVTLNSVTNGSTAETGYFLRFQTYQNTNCTSSPIDSTTIMYIYTNGQTVSLTVDPSLSFTLSAVAAGQSVNGDAATITTTTTTVPFGTVSASANAIGAHDITVGTNAAGGYTVYTRFTTQPVFSTSTIDDHSGSNASPTTFSAAGTEAFGYTTNDASLGTGTATRFTSGGGKKYAAYTTSNAEVSYSATPVASETTRVGYQVGVSNATGAGSYTTTVIYTATPIY